MNTVMKNKKLSQNFSRNTEFQYVFFIADLLKRLCYTNRVMFR